MARILVDKSMRESLRKKLYDDVDNGTVTPQQAVVALRKIVGLTQVEFAEKMKISVASLRAIEQGTVNPTLEMLNKLLKIGGLRVTVGRIG